VIWRLLLPLELTLHCCIISHVRVNTRPYIPVWAVSTALLRQTAIPSHSHFCKRTISTMSNYDVNAKFRRRTMLTPIDEEEIESFRSVSPPSYERSVPAARPLPPEPPRTLPPMPPPPRYCKSFLRVFFHDSLGSSSALQSQCTIRFLAVMHLAPQSKPLTQMIQQLVAC